MRLTHRRRYDHESLLSNFEGEQAGTGDIFCHISIREDRVQKQADARRLQINLHVRLNPPGFPYIAEILVLMNII